MTNAGRSSLWIRLLVASLLRTCSITASADHNTHNITISLERWLLLILSTISMLAHSDSTAGDRPITPGSMRCSFDPQVMLG